MLLSELMTQLISNLLVATNRKQFAKFDIKLRLIIIINDCVLNQMQLFIFFGFKFFILHYTGVLKDFYQRVQ